MTTEKNKNALYRRSNHGILGEDFRDLGSKMPGSRIKQEKAGWVAVAPTRRSQQPAMPTARQFYEGVNGFSPTLNRFPLGGLRLANFSKGRLQSTKTAAFRAFCGLLFFGMQCYQFFNIVGLAILYLLW